MCRNDLYVCTRMHVHTLYVTQRTRLPLSAYKNTRVYVHTRRRCQYFGGKYNPESLKKYIALKKQRCFCCNVVVVAVGPVGAVLALVYVIVLHVVDVVITSLLCRCCGNVVVFAAVEYVVVVNSNRCYTSSTSLTHPLYVLYTSA